MAISRRFVPSVLRRQGSVRRLTILGAVVLAFGLLAGVAPAADLPAQQAANPVRPAPAVGQQAQVAATQATVDNIVTTSFARTHLWGISKTATPDQLSLFDGASGSVDYDVVVTHTGSSDVYSITGAITITNGDTAGSVQSVAVNIAGIGAVTAVCDEDLPHSLAAGATLDCDYTKPVPNGTTRLNTVTVTMGDASTPQTTDNAVFGSPVEFNRTVTVTDTVKGNLGTVTAPDSETFEYRQTEDCAGAVWAGTTGTKTLTNTATVVGTTATATETVAVNCYRLGVSKTVNETVGSRHVWTIEKTAPISRLDLHKGDTQNVTFTVTVTNTKTTLAGWFVDGVITITNPAPMAAVVDVTDVLSKPAVASVTAIVNCDGDGLDVSIPAKGTKTCSYHAVLPNGDARTNTVTVTLDGIGTAFTATAAVDFTGAPTSTNLDGRVNVYDDNGTPGAAADDVLLGSITSGQAPYTFTRTVKLGFGELCGAKTYVNTAWLVGADTGTIVHDGHRIDVAIACDQKTPDVDNRGCTYGHGFWKNHLDEAAWATVGTNTTFFNSGQSYSQVIGMNSKGGNAYYILARQYIATKLNMANGAAAPAGVQSAFNDATALFQKYTPDEIGAMKGNDPIRKQFIHLVGDLGNYPSGACSGK